VSNGCTCHCQVFELPRVWRDCFTFLHLKFVGFLVLLTISGCTAHVVWLYFSSSNIFNFLMNDEIILFFVLSILSGCTVPNGCTSYRQAFELLLKWRDYFIFSTFVFCLFSCTFYIKWVVLLMWNGCTSPRHIVLLTSGGVRISRRRRRKGGRLTRHYTRVAPGSTTFSSCHFIS
jgi:hypothetical protein